MNVMTRNENPDVLQAIYRDIDLTLLGSCPLENGDAVGVPEPVFAALDTAWS